MNILEATNITKTYYSRGSSTARALNGVDLVVDEGEFLGIMGPSGSGKTTLLNILSGIDKATSGTIEIAGRNIFKMGDNELALFRRQKLGFVFQDYNLLDSLTIQENILLPMVLDKRYVEDMTERLNEIVNNFDIENILKKYPYEISGGQQQRVAICRAIVNVPNIVFADEPTGNLDSRSSRIVMESFEKLNKSNGGTVFLVTHDAFSASFCDRIVFLKDGAVHGQLIRRDGRKAFFEEIISVLYDIGGEEDVI